MLVEKAIASSLGKVKNYRRSETHRHSEAGPSSRAARYLLRNATVLNKCQVLQIRVKVEVIRDLLDMQAKSITLRQFNQKNDTFN